jgi:hypothetical protein
VKTKPTLPAKLSMPYTGAAQKCRHTLDVGKQALVLGRVVDQTLQSATNHGVLAHENDTLTAQGVTDLVHLLGR